MKSTAPLEVRETGPDTPTCEEVPMFSREAPEDELIVRLERGIVWPILESKATVPVPAVRLSPPDPSTVLLKRILPAPGPVFKTTVPSRETGAEKEILASEVVS